MHALPAAAEKRQEISDDRPGGPPCGVRMPTFIEWKHRGGFEADAPLLSLSQGLKEKYDYNKVLKAVKKGRRRCFLFQLRSALPQCLACISC